MSNNKIHEGKVTSQREIDNQTSKWIWKRLEKFRKKTEKKPYNKISIIHNGEIIKELNCNPEIRVEDTFVSVYSNGKTEYWIPKTNITNMDFAHGIVSISLFQLWDADYGSKIYAGSNKTINPIVKSKSCLKDVENDLPVAIKAWKSESANRCVIYTRNEQYGNVKYKIDFINKWNNQIKYLYELVHLKNGGPVIYKIYNLNDFKNCLFLKRCIFK